MEKIILFKKVDDGPFFTEKLSVDENSFLDKKVKLGSTISYRFQGVDREGFKMPMSEIFVVDL